MTSIPTIESPTTLNQPPISTSTTMGVNNFAPPMGTEQTINSLQRLIQLGGGFNSNSAPTMSVGLTHPGAPKTDVSQQQPNTQQNANFALLPKLRPMNAVPMNAVPISVSALSHGPPYMAKQTKPNATAAFSPQGNRNVPHQPQGMMSHPGQQFMQQQVQQPYTQQPSMRLPVQLMSTVPRRNLSTKRSIITIGSANRSSIPTSASQPALGSIPITKKQMDQRQQSSYSSACNATIRAQQKLNSAQQQRRGCVTNVAEDKDENDTRDEVMKSLVGKVRGAVVGLPPLLGSQQTVSRVGVKRTLDGVPRVPSTEKLGQGLQPSKVEPQHKYVEVFGGRIEEKQVSKSPISPHAYLQKLLVSRGYSTTHYCSLEGGYYCRPTPLQCASYGLSVVQGVRTSNVPLFTALLSAGLSRNPCNKFGESILHSICRRGDYNLLKLFLDNGSCVQISDDFGRTPLHDACWTAKPCFKSIQMLLARDLRLLHIVDCRGSPPLEYVKKESWAGWIEFLDANKEIYWPKRNLNEVCEECPPELVNVPPHSRPVRDPENCATLEDAGMYANGKKEILQ